MFDLRALDAGLFDLRAVGIGWVDSRAVGLFDLIAVSTGLADLKAVCLVDLRTWTVGAGLVNLRAANTGLFHMCHLHACLVWLSSSFLCPDGTTRTLVQRPQSFL